MHRIARALILSVVWALAGCDSGPSSPDGGLDGGLDGAAPTSELERDYCAPLAAWVCDAGRECGCGAVLPGGELDREACIARYTSECTTAWAGLATAIARGEARIRRDAASACIARLSSETPRCARPSGVTLFANCEPFFTGPAALDAPCANVPICADGAGVCVDGTCVARSTAGLACGSINECATGLVCVTGQCLPPAAMGEPCTDALPCGPPLQCIEGTCVALTEGACSSTSRCEVGARCEGGACVARASSTCTDDADCGNLSRCARSRACVPRATAGAPCELDESCAAGLYCDDASRTCVALPTEGQACGRGVRCAAGLGCDELGGSVCRAPGGEGAPCLLSERGPTICAGGLGCREGDAGPTCQALGVEGESCTFDNRCAEGFGCAFEATGSFCRVLGVEGQPCDNDQVCASGLYCDFERSQCTAKRSSGPCSAGNECIDICAPSASGGFECAARPTEGQSCVFVDDCAEGLACGAGPTGVCLDAICNEVL
jgi:hypothetical protein